MTRNKHNHSNHEGRPNGRPSRKSPKEWLKDNRDLVKAYIIFAVFTVVAFFAVLMPWGDKFFLEPLNRLTAIASGWLISIHDGKVQVVASSILSSSGGVNIKEGCNSVYATIIFLSGIVAFPTTWRKKLLGAILGTIALFAINLVRVVTLYYLSGYNKDLFDEAHLYIWQFAIIIVGGLLWLLWYDKIVNRKSVEKGL